MMNILEEAIIYATVMHQGKMRKFGNRPFILHPLEVAQILSTIPDLYPLYNQINSKEESYHENHFL